MSHICRCIFSLLTFCVMTGVVAGPVIAQSDESDQKALKQLQQAMSASLESDSYTMKVDKEVKTNSSISETKKGTVKFEKPYMYANMTTNIKGIGSSQSNEMIGKLGEGGSLQGLFKKKEDGNWTSAVSAEKKSYRKILDPFLDPSKLEVISKNVQSVGKETVNGTETLKIIAEKQEETKKKEGSKKKQSPNQKNLEVDVKDNKVTFWIRKDRPLIEKIKVDAKQVIKIGGGERSITKVVDLSMESTFSDYGSTSIKSEIKDVVDRKIDENK